MSFRRLVWWAGGGAVLVAVALAAVVAVRLAGGKTGGPVQTVKAPAKTDEVALLAQLDRVLDAERQIKRLQIGLLVWIKNSLTPEQLAKLSAITKDGAASLIDATRNRLTSKVDRVRQAAQKMAASGRDPSAIARMMDEKVKPLLDAGNPLEAEIQLDRILAEIEKSGAN